MARRGTGIVLSAQQLHRHPRILTGVAGSGVYVAAEDSPDQSVPTSKGIASVTFDDRIHPQHRPASGARIDGDGRFTIFIKLLTIQAATAFTGSSA